MSTPIYISVKRAEELLGVSRRTIFRRIEDGTITRHAVGGLLRLDEREIHEKLAPTSHYATDEGGPHD